MSAMSPLHRSQFFGNAGGGTPGEHRYHHQDDDRSHRHHQGLQHQHQQEQEWEQRNQREEEEEEEERQQQQHDGGVIFTHLFSAPLIERKPSDAAEKVDELSYQGERDTLHRTLDNAGKRVRFLSEAANTRSFARAVGCPPPAACSSSSSTSSFSVGKQTSGCSSGGDDRGSCRDGEMRILHFTGHGVEGQLTFEDDSGQLQYIDEEELLTMLFCGRSHEQRAIGGGTGSGDSGDLDWPPAGAPGGTATTPPLRREAEQEEEEDEEEADFGGGFGYAPFEDISESMEPEFRLGGRQPSSMGGRKGEGGPPRTGLQLVFLSSCHSQSVAKCFIEAGVRHVIAVKRDSKVLDHKAAEFAKSFYTSLLRGDTVRQAFLLGSACLEGSDQPEEGHKFLLLPPDGNHDIPVFEEVPAGQFVDATPLKPPYRCDALTQYFWGRAVDVQEVVKHMVHGAPCVTITGQKGIGKTQVLLKACAYTRERNVFGEILFCRVDKADGGNDACSWLEKGFLLPAGSLGAHNMDGAVAKITEHVRNHLMPLMRQRGSSKRALLVLDGCSEHVVVGQERVYLRDLLSRLLAALDLVGVRLTAAVTMRATGPETPGQVGVPGEKSIVVEELDARSTAELFVMCCSRSLSVFEIDPNDEAITGSDGRRDRFGAFARSDIVRALRGHPACVQDLCRCRRVHEERGLFLYRRELLEDDIPKLQAQYAYADERSRRRASFNRSLLHRTHHVEETVGDGFEWLWDEVAGTRSAGFYGSSRGGDAEEEKEGGGDGGRREGGDRGIGVEATWGELCKAISKYFARRVPGARARPLSADDFELFASDAALWRRQDGPTPAKTAEKRRTRVSQVTVSRKKLEPFWRWFWQAVTTLKRTSAWCTGLETSPALGFAGFMRKEVALSLLSSAEPGTFLIRFSTSTPGALAVHYAATSRSRRGTVVSGIVNVDKRRGLSVKKGNRTFHDLDDLVLSTGQLKFLLYHDSGSGGTVVVRKEEVFGRPQRRESWSGARRATEELGETVSRRLSMPPM